MDFSYCTSPFSYHRFVTREVKIGGIAMGGNNPIRVQSMTTTDTMDTMATVEQSVRMIEAGCELVRITAPSIREAENLAEIKKELRKRGYQTPLVADIHFTPNAAEIAARLVEKVRINPGNFADKKKFAVLDYTDSEYLEELERIRKKFIPLVRICKEYGTAMRIGTNHGSLSDRIMSRYGDTPLGMVESALEFLRIAEEENFYSIVLSMKSSNPQVMVQAYRLLVKKMQEENMYYPLHLGVTEAGDGEDGRIKSAVGIGTLLEDGLGDTIRVSLTEEPEFEIPVAKALAERYSRRVSAEPSEMVLSESEKLQLFSSGYSPYDYSRNPTLENMLAGGGQVPKVVGDLSSRGSILPQNLFALGYQYNPSTDKWNIGDMACDFLFAGNADITFELPGTLSVIQHYPIWCTQKEKERHFPLIDFRNYELLPDHEKDSMFFVQLREKELNIVISTKDRFKKPVIWLISNEGIYTAQQMRTMLFKMRYAGVSQPILIHVDYKGISQENLQLYAAADLGCLLTEGFGDGIWLHADGDIGKDFINRLSFGVLQATRTRISKTEYISCPSCGRTLFDLQETTARIRKETDHLKGLKIGIMGCIVNGPGEMADADYGYVGSGPGKITLYKGKEVVLKSIDTPLAVDALIELIRKNGDWVDKPE